MKAAPVLTHELEEAMCVAGVSLGSDPKWIRLFPVPFRDLQDDEKFKKYQVVRLTAVRPRSDRRPESWTPIEGTLQLGRVLDTAHDWSERRELISHLDEHTMCDLVAANASGSGTGIPSLGVVRPAGPPTLEITERDPEQIRLWTELAEAEAAKVSLFDEPGATKTPLEAVPWRFRYRYMCRYSDCEGHAQTIVDWELVALWRNVRHESDWQDLIRQKYIDDMSAEDRETILFVGNQVKWPRGFLVLGVFWPPDSALKPRSTSSPHSGHLRPGSRLGAGDTLANLVAAYTDHVDPDTNSEEFYHRFTDSHGELCFSFGATEPTDFDVTTRDCHRVSELKRVGPAGDRDLPCSQV